MLNRHTSNRQYQVSLFSRLKRDSEGTAKQSPELRLKRDLQANDSGWKMQQRTSQKQRLRQVERNLRSSLNLSTIFGAAVVESAALLEAQRVGLIQYHLDSQRWQPVAQYCRNQSIAWSRQLGFTQAEYPVLVRDLIQGQWVSIHADQPLPSAEIRQWLACWSGNWLLVPVQHSRQVDYSINAQLSYPPQGSLPSLGFSMVAAGHPFTEIEDRRENHWGVLALALPENKRWTPDAIACVQSIAQELSLAMSQAQQHQSLRLANQELQKLALSDGLTCLANRRRFDKHLSSEWQRLTRDRQPLSLILCDLDHFKRYNDTFGHPAGDRCLIRVARALLSGPQRPADLVARYGGEEFAVILPNTDTNGAWRIAQKIHKTIRDLKIAHAADNEKPYVTVTMGVATVVPGQDTSAQVLVQAADLALYHAKQQGRDRTYVHAIYNTVNSGEAEMMNPGEGTQPVAMTPEEQS